jgi:hypothetical protein
MLGPLIDFFKAMLGSAFVPLLLALCFGFIYFVFLFIGIDINPVISLMLVLTPIWLPLVLWPLFFENWSFYIQTKWALNNGRTTLRIKLPQSVRKSPEAMEAVISQIHNPSSSDNLFQTYIDGKHPLMFSFELVSIGGDVRFYINVPSKKTKNAVEAQLYAHYPGIEVVEEPIDYTGEIPWDTEKYEYMSFRIGKKKDQEFPIKTYFEWHMDQIPKEENEVFEPMAAMIEQMASVGPKERVWLQILARPHIEKGLKSGHLSPAPAWDKKVREKIDEMMGREKGKKTGPMESEEVPRLTPGERDTIVAMERNAGKYAYETAIRWMYIAEKGNFNGNFIGPMLRTFSQYDVIGRNAVGFQWRTDFDYNMFSDRSGWKKTAMKKWELDQYKKRRYSCDKWETAKTAPKVFTTEELATMYHIPNAGVITPGLARIPSTRAEAPPNLPTGMMPSL